MRHAVMVSGSYPCVRAGKIAEALKENGWGHSVIGRQLPPQFTDVYETITTRKNGTREEVAETVRKMPGELVHVHNEPNWTVPYIRAVDDRPIIFNVHDVTSARPLHPEDPNFIMEAESYAAADAFVFVTEQQRTFAISKGFDIEGKPYACVGNYASSSTLVERKLLPHLGGVVYAGGMEKRGAKHAWRDLSPLADFLGNDFHYYPGGGGVDYGTGTKHPTVLEYRLLTHRLAQHDWGFSGTLQPCDAWEHSSPNKAYEYLAAGIPVVALNNPLLKSVCELGLGVYLDDFSQMKHLPPAKQFRTDVRLMRYRYTMSYHIAPVVELYEKVLT